MSVVENVRSAELRTAGSAAIHPLDAIRILSPAGKALLAQVALHGQLALIEWAEKKARLLKMQLFVLLGFACAIGAEWASICNFTRRACRGHGDD